MKIYFLETNGNNMVIITDGDTAKIFDAAPSGFFDGIDLYQEDTAEQLRNHFSRLDSAGGLNDFESMYSPDEISFSDICEELEDAILIYETI